MSSKQEPPKLGGWARGISGLLGLALVISSGVAVYFPPTPSTVVYDKSDVQISRTSTPSDLSSVLVTLALSGVGLILFGINGYRFTRFSAAGVSADSEAVAQQAKKEIEAESDATQKIEIDKRSDPEPAAPQAPVATIEADDESYAVYALADVPAKLIGDALAGWPADHNKPSTLADLEYASRKKGKGNHAWQLKFRGIPPVRVTYGGHAKSDPTVVHD